MRLRRTLIGYIDTLGEALVGAVAGIALATGVIFSAGWAVTAPAVEARTAEAQADVLGQICERHAYDYWTEHLDRTAAELSGFNNEARARLAHRFAPDLALDASVRERVIRVCNKALQPA